MGVTVRQKRKGKGESWWIFVAHNGKRTSRCIGDRQTAERVASEIRAGLQGENMGTVYKRGNIWWIKFYQNGKPYYESTKSEDMVTARKLLKVREGDVARKELIGLVEKNGVSLATVNGVMPKTPVVYFIQRGESGPVKIGFSRNVYGRMQTLQTANSQPLRLVGYLYGDTELEGDIQSRFAEDRLKGEWFKPTYTMKSFLESL